MWFVDRYGECQEQVAGAAGVCFFLTVSTESPGVRYLGRYSSAQLRPAKPIRTEQPPR
ncbi:hypothetical protein J2Z79_002514 [Symbiobacterium terraclitae]|uniref:Uncharacterized protein n=1 Tax=Symbiobacterium terraclitae TaxID=557451 RepID=A0ABS4JU73_9FIRM|nr:hypothetical protein [Symbiobacterium terraclitae]